MKNLKFILLLLNVLLIGCIANSQTVRADRIIIKKQMTFKNVAIDSFSTDTLLVENSDNVMSTQKAIKTYVDNMILQAVDSNIYATKYYVDISIPTFSNGLTKSGGDVKLGGTLVNPTAIVNSNANFLVVADTGLVGSLSVAPSAIQAWSKNPGKDSTGVISVSNGNVLLRGVSANDTSEITITPEDITINGDIRYTEDFSIFFSDRSIPDVAYVKGLISDSLSSALPIGTEGHMMYNDNGAWTSFSGMYWDDVNGGLSVGTSQAARGRLDVVGIGNESALLIDPDNGIFAMGYYDGDYEGLLIENANSTPHVRLGSGNISGNGTNIQIDDANYTIIHTARTINFDQAFGSGGIYKGIVYIGAGSDNQTASTEIPSLTLTTTGRQWATGALPLQREVLITQPIYSFSGASTITNAATLGIAGAPIKSTNATITNTHGLLIEAGAVSTATNSYGLTVNAQTGAANNYAAAFLGGNIGIRTTNPQQALHVNGKAKIDSLSVVPTSLLGDSSGVIGRANTGAGLTFAAGTLSADTSVLSTKYYASTLASYSLDGQNNVDGRFANITFAAGAINNTVLGLNVFNNTSTSDSTVFIGTGVGLTYGNGAKGSTYIGNTITTTAGSDAVVIGSRITSSGSNSIAIGYNNSVTNVGTTGDIVIGQGNYASGGGNILIGNRGGSAVAGTNGVYIGTSAGGNQSITNGVFIGNSAGTGAINGSLVNIAIGPSTLTGTNGGRNVAIGESANASSNNTSNTENVSIGYNAGKYTLNENVAIGAYASDANAASYQSVAIGTYALSAAHETGNTAIGYSAGKAVSGANSGNNVLIGYYTAENLSTSSQSNTMVGSNSGQAHTSAANYNTFVGAAIASNATSVARNSDAATIIGWAGGNSASRLDSAIIIGYRAGWNNSSYQPILIGNGLEATGNFQARIGSTHTLYLSNYGGGTKDMLTTVADRIMVSDGGLNQIGDMTKDTLKTWIAYDVVATEDATSPTTAVKFSILPINVSGAIHTVNPPASPIAGDWFAVSDSRGNAGANNITVDFVTATQNFHGASATHVMNANKAFVRFTYVNSTVGWIITN
jgi:uncharacterized protein with GYD domain